MAQAAIAIAPILLEERLLAAPLYGVMGGLVVFEIPVPEHELPVQV